MTPEEAWALPWDGGEIEKRTDEELALRIQHAIETLRGQNNIMPISEFAKYTIAEIKRRPSCDHLLVALKLRGEL